MTSTENAPLPDTFREYGTLAIRGALDKMLTIADAVRHGADIEAVHDMRVASRRLRAAITMFGPVFASKEFERFERYIKAVTRDLGAARDLDVMIQTLEAMEMTLRPEEQAGVEDFVRVKRQERAELQPRVLRTLDKTEQHNLRDMFDAIAHRSHGDKPESVESPAGDFAPAPAIDADGSVRSNAARIVPQRVAELLSWEPFAGQPDRVEELHNMRIAAKRLRYTLELFAPHYGGALKGPINQVKKIQEQLGEIHDADVMVPALAAHLRKVLANGVGDRKGIPSIGVHSVNVDAAQGLLALCRTRRDARDAVYARFLQTWSAMRADGFFDRLWVTVNAGAHEEAATVPAADSGPLLAPSGGQEHESTGNGHKPATSRPRGRRAAARAAGDRGDSGPGSDSSAGA